MKLQNTELSLKKIVENMDRMPSTLRQISNDDAPKLTTEEKRRLMGMVSRYNEYGESIRREEEILEVAKAISEIAKMAGTYAMNEAGDWFQGDVIKKDFANMDKEAKEFSKIARECYSGLQKLNSIYENCGHLISRYFEINDPMQPTDIQGDPKEIPSQQKLSAGDGKEMLKTDEAGLTSEDDISEPPELQI